mmetsp:Transcript_25326/g.60248  ORF Transcript_25326/g.60248 Transcript_25326/m.60248 type:complete len:286 (-) Transcript_25326:667-1524(-)
MRKQYAGKCDLLRSNLSVVFFPQYFAAHGVGGPGVRFQLCHGRNVPRGRGKTVTAVGNSLRCGARSTRPDLCDCCLHWDRNFQAVALGVRFNQGALQQKSSEVLHGTVFPRRVLGSEAISPPPPAVALPNPSQLLQLSHTGREEEEPASEAHGRREPVLPRGEGHGGVGEQHRRRGGDEEPRNREPNPAEVAVAERHHEHLPPAGGDPVGGDEEGPEHAADLDVPPLDVPHDAPGLGAEHVGGAPRGRQPRPPREVHDTAETPADVDLCLGLLPLQNVQFDVFQI